MKKAHAEIRMNLLFSFSFSFSFFLEYDKYKLIFVDTYSICFGLANRDFKKSSKQSD